MLHKDFILHKILEKAKLVSTRPLSKARTYKNFGHKRVPESTFTILWHGFLTFTLIGCGLNWEKIGKIFYSSDVNDTPERILEVNEEN